MDIVTVTLLPVVFMFHDFEEIIFFRPWLDRNSSWLREKFPRLSERILPRLESLSTSGFALAVAEEFVVLCIITYGSVYFNSYYLWLALFMAFFIHLVIHLVQWIIVRRYVPVIVTTLVSLPWCVYVLAGIIDGGIFSVSEILLWAIAGLAIMIVNLVFAHRLGNKFDEWAGSHSLSR